MELKKGTISSVLIIEGYEMDLQAIEQVRNLVTDRKGVSGKLRADVLMMLKRLEQDAKQSIRSIAGDGYNDESDGE